MSTIRKGVFTEKAFVESKCWAAGLEEGLEMGTLGLPEFSSSYEHELHLCCISAHAVKLALLKLLNLPFIDPTGTWALGSVFILVPFMPGLLGMTT